MIFSNYIKKIDKEKTAMVEVITVLDDVGLYSTDFLKLYNFFAKSDLTRKINGFIEAQRQAESASKTGLQSESVKTSKSVWYTLREFVRVLSLNPTDG